MRIFIYSTIRFSLLIAVAVNAAKNVDRFNYRETVGTDFGPADWDAVSCDDVGECLGWPDGWELGVGWRLERNSCEWCPDTGNDCGLHRQSPINLDRSDSTTGHDPECYDYHWMAYNDGSCDWHDIVKNGYSIHSNNFKIERHSLQILQPLDGSGELQCNSGENEAKFPRLDYSKGFPDFWYLSHTEVTVPSEHTQEGKRYDAEVHLAHFYSIDHQRRVGKVALFLEADASRERWDFLDKLICQWREVEEATRDECGIESVPPYPGCRNPTRETGETDLPYVDPYPFIDCDSVENSNRICKSSSCCESERSQSNYCQNDVYGKYGDETVGSICWWCCPGKLLAPTESAAVQEPKTTPPVASPTPTTSPPVASPTSTPSLPVTSPTPTISPSVSSPSPTTPLPVAIPTPRMTPEPISTLVCSEYEGHPDININRICKGCCNPVRSSTDHCHFVYKFFGENMESMCSDCCEPTKELGPAPPEHPIYPPIDCTAVMNPFRICKPNSCCDNFPSAASFCDGIYEEYLASLASICWYCCSEPIDIDVPNSPQELPSGNMAPSKSPFLDPLRSPTPVSILVCSEYDDNPDINMNRICKDGGCCDSLRSSSDHCHVVYKFFGEAMESVCSDCCQPSKELAPAPPEHPIYPPIDCTTVMNPFRICKSDSCCDNFPSTGDFCDGVYENYSDNISSICWYCCSEPIDIDPLEFGLRMPKVHSLQKKPQNRNLQLRSNQEKRMKVSSLPTKQRAGSLKPSELLSSSNSMTSKGTENQKKKDVGDKKVYKLPTFESREQEHSRRLDESLTGDNYINVPYSPYEWMREVKTEYYFRYEGTQMVPPCYETVHYRVMKDPIRIHPDQLAELERLLAWRIAPKGSDFSECQRDTAGRERSGSNGNAVDLNRPLQSYSNIHRKVFCGCNDWESKFQEDRDWCDLDQHQRRTTHPYNFDSVGGY